MMKKHQFIKKDAVILNVSASRGRLPQPSEQNLDRTKKRNDELKVQHIRPSNGWSKKKNVVNVYKTQINGESK